MTEQEAIETLRLNGGLEIGGKVKRVAEFLEGIDVAIKALEKQIPKKPDYEADGYDENGNLIVDYAKCPVCGHDFEYGINDWECDYCSDCGQRLAWSE